MINDGIDRFVDLRIEVKSSRRGKFRINARELGGISSNNEDSFGFVAALINSAKEKGPYWALIPAEKVSPRGYNENVLCRIKKRFDFWAPIDYMWGNFLLDRELVDKLLKIPKIDQEATKWLSQLPIPRVDMPQDLIRNYKVSDALQEFRQRLDAEHGKHSYKREGFLHQCILYFCLLKSGFEVTSNRSGVPDLRTKIKISNTSSNDFQPHSKRLL